MGARFRTIGIAIVLVIMIAVGTVLLRGKTPATVSRATDTRVADPTVDVSRLPVRTTQSVHSPDGTRIITLETINPPGATTSSVLARTSEISGRNVHTIYRDDVPRDAAVHVPANSWSPDNAFVFVTFGTGDQMRALVFRSQGELFSDGASFIDLSNVFSDKVDGVTIRDVTGWDDPSLLHVMTYGEDGARGPSYWFDVWSRSFIKLAHR